MSAKPPEPSFAIYPAIDLRNGKVVRLKQGDPSQETIYHTDPAFVARKWVLAGAKWLHIVNLDAALSVENPASQAALVEIVKVAKTAGVRTQLGGGLRSMEAIGKVLNMGINRAILGTAALKQPFVLAAALDRWGPERIAVSLDTREGLAMVAGWTEETGRDAVSLARWFYNMGLRWLIVTDVARDGMPAGIDLPGSLTFTQATGLHVITAGGANSLEDVRAACQSKLAGIVVGRALYDGTIDPAELFALTQDTRPC